jgi:penicillin-binding protein 1A
MQKGGASKSPALMAKQVVASGNDYIMTQALRGVIQHGTGRAALVLKRSDLAGKTGTTNDQRDAWFAGFNSNVACIAWVGYDDLGSLYEYGSKAALPIWIDYMRDVLANQPESTMPMPKNIALARIDPKTGLLAAADQKNAVFEYFRRRYIPNKYADSDTENKKSNPYIAESSNDKPAAAPLF